MIEVSRSTGVGVPPTKVWDVLGDFGSVSRWASNVDRSCLLTEQSEGEGIVRRIQTGPATVLERVVVWNPPGELAYEIEGLPSVVKSVTNTWRVQAQGDGSSVTLTSRIDAGPRPPQQAIARLVGRKMAQASERLLEGLAAQCG